MKKILVFGARGMAGHMVYMYLKSLNKYEIYNTVTSNHLDENSIRCNVLNIDKVNEIISDLNPEIIINCIGILNDKSDLNLERTAFLNTFFPKYLENRGRVNNIKIIHISTDCVFTGNKGSYTETDFKDESNMYGLSKNFGEIINTKDLTFRTSIIGPELKENGKGLFHWFMNQEGKVDGYNNVYWSGITTLELAKAIDKAIETNLCGLYQLVSKDKISKHYLLSIIKKEFNKLDVEILHYYGKIVDKSLVNTRDDFDFTVNNYNEMIKDMKTWMINNNILYKQYLV